MTKLTNWTTLKAVAEEGEASPDWEYGESMIRDSFFKEYAAGNGRGCWRH